jgi:hypothetical protein
MCCKAGIPAGQGPKHTRYAAYFGVTPEVLAHSANVGLDVLGGL